MKLERLLQQILSRRRCHLVSWRILMAFSAALHLFNLLVEFWMGECLSSMHQQVVQIQGANEAPRPNIVSHDTLKPLAKFSFTCLRLCRQACYTEVQVLVLAVATALQAVLLLHCILATFPPPFKCSSALLPTLSVRRLERSSSRDMKLFWYHQEKTTSVEVCRSC